jgi:hypothetical protein
MGKKREHQNRLLELAKEIMALGKAIQEMEKIWNPAGPPISRGVTCNICESE